MTHRNDFSAFLPMPLSEAQAVLNSIGYQETWTDDQLRKACDGKLDKFTVEMALRVTANAAIAEAEALEKLL
ncbi:hypothetical protein GCM10023208_23610 [Erythrobacter westpacificensis]|uniref:Uncharacterized protein n=1 Tax=Erythrobacter westpacificensis TaxID=1055231 RepID=A0ABP9KI72_9SPHN